MHLTWLIKWNTLKVHVAKILMSSNVGILAYLAKSTGHHDPDRNLDLFQKDKYVSLTAPNTNLCTLGFRIYV